MLAQTVALAAASLGVLQPLTLLGQARTLRRRRTVREVSLPFLFLAVLCSVSWFCYGIMHRDVALLLVNAVGLAGAAVTLTTAVRLRAGEADAVAAKASAQAMAAASAARTVRAAGAGTARSGSRWLS